MSNQLPAWISNAYTIPPPNATQVTASQVMDPFSFSVSLKAMIGMRLHLGLGTKFPFDFIECHKTRQNKVFVFVVVDDNNVTLEDEWELFPSDALITQLILMKEKNK